MHRKRTFMLYQSRENAEFSDNKDKLALQRERHRNKQLFCDKKYKIFRRSIKITYGKPYKVKQELEIENNRLMNTVKRMIKEGNDKN